jgi:hypothetical protein
MRSRSARAARRAPHPRTSPLRPPLVAELKLHRHTGCLQCCNAHARMVGISRSRYTTVAVVRACVRARAFSKPMPTKPAPSACIESSMTPMLRRVDARVLRIERDARLVKRHHHNHGPTRFNVERVRGYAAPRLRPTRPLPGIVGSPSTVTKTLHSNVMAHPTLTGRHNSFPSLYRAIAGRHSRHFRLPRNRLLRTGRLRDGCFRLCRQGCVAKMTLH